MSGILAQKEKRFARGGALQLSPALIKRFEQRINKNADNGCWEWTHSLNNQGYGFMGVWRDGKSKKYLAHRVSWSLYRGDIPDGLFVLHKCDNPKCVNPDHLFIGNQSDNMYDCARKGRHGGGGPKGENHPMSRLTKKDVYEIKRLHKTGKITQTLLGKIWRVTVQQINHIVRGVHWKDTV